MSSAWFNKPHILLLVTILALSTLAGFVSRASTKAMERAVTATTSELMGSRATDYQWESLRDGMVFGRILYQDEAVYLFNLRLFGGDNRYALTIQNDGYPKNFIDLGTGPVSPHASRIALVMRAYFGGPLRDTTALDAIIAHAMLENFQTIANHERSRKEPHRGD